MNDTGLVAICGIPGSGKNLLAVIRAKLHYRKENAFYRYYLALFKYKVLEYIKSSKFIQNILLKLDKIKSHKLFNNIIFRIIRFCIKWFINIFLFICLFFKFSIYFKLFIIFYLFFMKKFIKSFNELDYKYFELFPYKKINSVYSSFPILLDKKRNIRSNVADLYDLDSRWSFLPNSLIIIDEVQLFVDSDEYKNKTKNQIISMVAKFLQAHRHFGIKQILYISQSPSRIFKKARNITVGYLKMCKRIDLPFGISVLRGVMYYDFEYYGRYIPKDRDERKKLPFDYKKVTKFFIRSSIFGSYDSRYLSLYNYNKPLLNRGTWKAMKVPYNDLKIMFEVYD